MLMEGPAPGWLAHRIDSKDAPALMGTKPKLR
jgi:hypothetical protein